MRSEYTALIKRDGAWWIGWIEEIPGANAQESTREELLTALAEVLKEALASNRQHALEAAGEGYSEVKIAV